MTTRKTKKRGRHAKPLRACTKTDFSEKIVLLWIAFDQASRECISFIHAPDTWRPGEVRVEMNDHAHTLRRREMAALANVEDELKRRGFDVEAAMTQLERLRPTARQSREPAPTPRRTRSKTTN
jgi:hypothetical protein